MRTGAVLNTTTTTHSVPSGPHSPWHSPVPYLFGGLAAMLGLIAFALLILACSYWKLSGYLDNNGDGSERDLENGDEKDGETIKVAPVFEEKIVVIMAGDEKPTFLATPIASRASSFGDNSSTNNNNSNNNNNKDKENEQKSDKTELPRRSSDDQTENREETTSEEQNH